MINRQKPTDKVTTELTFFKYQGAGNDFVMIDNRAAVLKGNERQLYAKLCNRRFGIGADGLILLQNIPGYDFEMKYYNADGNESTMCGNGGRCVVMFAKQLGLIENATTFLAIDGPHKGLVLPNGTVSLQMGDVTTIAKDKDAFVLSTGSPHYVQPVDLVKDVDVYDWGKLVRYSPKYREEGINVNFMELSGDRHLKVRTYERGVEDETYACGTGVTACAIVASEFLGSAPGNYEYEIETLGGVLSVSYQWNGTGATDVWLKGPAVRVFEGQVEISF